MEYDFSPKRGLTTSGTRRRASCWRNRFGPCYVSTPACMDPADPSRVYCQNVEWKVDLDRAHWATAAVMFEARPDTPYFHPHGVNNMVYCPPTASRKHNQRGRPRRPGAG